MEDKKSCVGCGAKCCKYVAMEIDAPEDINDFENIRWYVAHENVNVFIENDDTWNVEFVTPCSYLEDDKCSIHEEFVSGKIKRPSICRDFNTEECPHHNEYEEPHRFEKMEDVDKYIKEVFDAGLHEIAKE
jgi:hypothetical protein